MRHTLLLRFLLLATLAVGSSACALDSNEGEDEGESATLEEPLTRVSEAQRRAAQQTDLAPLTYTRLTPTSTAIMRGARYWMDAQENESSYPRARMCATNVSKVLFLAGITRYDQEGVRALLADIGRSGGALHRMPQEPAAFGAALETRFGGRIPAGTVVSGLHINMSRPGDQHIGFIGHEDPDGTIWIYHNNWYRPENEGGRRKAHMVSAENLSRGRPRQWMATPWIRVTRDAAGKISDVTSLLPALDDMDPFNDSYRVTLAVLPEVARELAR